MRAIPRSFLLVTILFASTALANTPPNTPTITQPVADGTIVNPADVHMETAPFADPDAGDTHRCTDWEIWTTSPTERVWLTACIGGVERVHTHLGDGVFMGSYAGRTELKASTNYRLRVRHRDSSNDPATEWSAWAERLFQTGAASGVFPLLLDDVAATPAPQWLDPLNKSMVLPGGATPATLRLGGADGSLLLEFQGTDPGPLQVNNPTPLPAHVNLRIRLDSGNSAGSVVLPQSRLLFTDDHGIDHVVYLPAVNLAASSQAYFWVSTNGSSYVATAAQTQPDFSTLARGTAVPWAVRQPGFQVEIMATGFQLPVNIAFVPNPGAQPNSPYYYVTELYGTIKVVTRNGVVHDYATNLLNFNPTGNFPGSGEQGLAGIVIEPTTGDVFADVLYDSPTSPGNHYPKVIRLHSTDGGLTAASISIVKDMPGETQGQSHQISNLSFGPDGKLYVHMGDGFDASKGQDLTSFRGKILRMNLDGTAPTDNPFYNAADGITSRDYAFAYGLRNPFGGAWRAADSSHYEVENGPSVDRIARIVRGRNYLYDGSDTSMANFAIYNWNPAVAPVNIAFIQPTTWSGSGFPAAKMDHAFVAESGPTWATGPQSNGKRISEFVLDANGVRVSGPTPLIEYIGSGKATAVGLTAGPDGLYFSDLYKDLNYTNGADRGANILRVKFVGTADFKADVTTGNVPLTVHFTDQSNVPGASGWQWNFGDGDGSTDQNPTHTYTHDGVYDVRLSVTGNTGVSILQKPAYIRVGALSKVAMICGSSPPIAADQAIADYLTSLGVSLDLYDDEPANRPPGATLVSGYDLVIVSSTITSANVAGEFRDLNVPLLYWEQALNRTDREPLASNGNAFDAVTSIRVEDVTHPIMAGMAGGTVPVFSSPARMSIASDSFGPGVSVLATRDGFPAQAAIMAADKGAALLGGRMAPARRVFFFLEDASWSAINATGQQLLKQAVYWALAKPLPTVPPDFDHDLDVDQDDFGHLQACFTGIGIPVTNPACDDAKLDGDVDVDAADLSLFMKCRSAPNVPATPGCVGS